MRAHGGETGYSDTHVLFTPRKPRGRRSRVEDDDSDAHRRVRVCLGYSWVNLASFGLF